MQPTLSIAIRGNRPRFLIGLLPLVVCWWMARSAIAADDPNTAGSRNIIRKRSTPLGTTSIRAKGAKDCLDGSPPIARLRVGTSFCRTPWASLTYHVRRSGRSCRFTAQGSSSYQAVSSHEIQRWMCPNSSRLSSRSSNRSVIEQGNPSPNSNLEP